MTTKVLSVGQCAMDHGSISRFLDGEFDATVVGVDDGDEAADRLASETFDLVLVNRVLDRTGDDGLAVVRRLLGRAGSTPPVMLVTNFPDWQQRAVALGAVEGFGKAELHTAPCRSRLAAYLASHDAESTAVKGDSSES